MFLLRMLERIAVNFRSRRKNERRLFVLGQTERVVRAERADFKRGDWEFQVIDWTGGRCEVKYVIDLLFRQKDEVRDVVFDESEFLGAGEMGNVRCVSSDEIVDGDDPMPFSQKPFHEMRTEEARTSGDDRNCLEIFGHLRSSCNRYHGPLPER